MSGTFKPLDNFGKVTVQENVSNLKKLNPNWISTYINILESITVAVINVSAHQIFEFVKLVFSNITKQKNIPFYGLLCVNVSSFYALPCLIITSTLKVRVSIT